MKQLNEEYDLLLSGIDPMEGDMARDLLLQRGIPSLIAGPDFSVAGFGHAVHDALHHPDLYVPKGSKIAARAILAEAWGEERLARLDPNPA